MSDYTASRMINLAGEPGTVTAERRALYDTHKAECPACTTTCLCYAAEGLWRSVVLAALKDSGVRS